MMSFSLVGGGWPVRAAVSAWRRLAPHGIPAPPAPAPASTTASRPARCRITPSPTMPWELLTHAWSWRLAASTPVPDTASPPSATSPAWTSPRRFPRARAWVPFRRSPRRARFEVRQGTAAAVDQTWATCPLRPGSFMYLRHWRTGRETWRLLFTPPCPGYKLWLLRWTADTETCHPLSMQDCLNRPPPRPTDLHKSLPLHRTDSEVCPPACRPDIRRYPVLYLTDIRRSPVLHLPDIRRYPVLYLTDIRRYPVLHLPDIRRSPVLHLPDIRRPPAL